jgi:MFS family permease
MEKITPKDRTLPLAKKFPLFINRNFLLLWTGQGLSVLGDQFAMIGLPWLVLQLTGDPLALGTVLALQGIPRAVFMLVGGAVTDRFSPRSVMLVSDISRLILFGILALVTCLGQVQLWMLYLLSIIFGLVSGFFNPASTSIVPHLVPTERLQFGNSIIQATAQMSTFIGPGLAGFVIALLSRQGVLGMAATQIAGIGMAFAIDALSFLVSAITLYLMRDSVLSSEKKPDRNMVLAIKEGIIYVWRDPFLRIAYILLMAVNLLCVGPLEVGIPVMADKVFTEGVQAFGLIMAAYGGGNLAGIILAGFLPRPAPSLLKRITIFLILLFGTGLIGMSLVSLTVICAGIALLMGIGNGYLALSYITLIQQQSPSRMLGRVMSLLMLANLGLGPLSQAIAGGLIKLSLPGVFIGAGLLIVLVGVWASSRDELVAVRTRAV